MQNKKTPATPARVAVVKPQQVIFADTREQAIPPFPSGVLVERVTMGEGDYTAPSIVDVARIERKSAGDFAASLTFERERFTRELERLRAYQFRIVIVEADLVDFLDGRIRSKVHPNAIVGSICSLYSRFGVATLFAHDAETCGRMIAGILRRIEEQHATAAVAS